MPDHGAWALRHRPAQARSRRQRWDGLVAAWLKVPPSPAPPLPQRATMFSSKMRCQRHPVEEFELSIAVSMVIRPVRVNRWLLFAAAPLTACARVAPASWPVLSIRIASSAGRSGATAPRCRCDRAESYRPGPGHSLRVFPVFQLAMAAAGALGVASTYSFSAASGTTTVPVSPHEHDPGGRRHRGRSGCNLALLWPSTHGAPLGRLKRPTRCDRLPARISP